MVRRPKTEAWPTTCRIFSSRGLQRQQRPAGALSYYLRGPQTSREGVLTAGKGGKRSVYTWDSLLAQDSFRRWLRRRCTDGATASFFEREWCESHVHRLILPCARIGLIQFNFFVSVPLFIICMIWLLFLIKTPFKTRYIFHVSLFITNGRNAY